jgi:4-hydroxy-3-methylbut-2-enyl diphosphate reductase IspH
VRLYFIAFGNDGIKPKCTRFLCPFLSTPIQTADAHPNANNKIVIIGYNNHTEEKHTRKKETQAQASRNNQSHTRKNLHNQQHTNDTAKFLTSSRDLS